MHATSTPSTSLVDTFRPALTTRAPFSLNSNLNERINAIITWFKENRKNFGEPTECKLLNLVQRRYEKWKSEERSRNKSGPKKRGRPPVSSEHLICYRCFCTKTSKPDNRQWRRGPYGEKNYCDGCGQKYLKEVKAMNDTNTQQKFTQYSFHATPLNHISSNGIKEDNLMTLLNNLACTFGTHQQEDALMKNAVNRFKELFNPDSIQLLQIDSQGEDQNTEESNGNMSEEKYESAMETDRSQREEAVVSTHSAGSNRLGLDYILNPECNEHSIDYILSSEPVNARLDLNNTTEENSNSRMEIDRSEDDEAIVPTHSAASNRLGLDYILNPDKHRIDYILS